MTMLRMMVVLVAAIDGRMVLNGRRGGRLAGSSLIRGVLKKRLTTNAFGSVFFFIREGFGVVQLH